MNDIAFRRMQPSDRNFVAASWFQSYYSDPHNPVKDRAEYKRVFAPVIDHLLDCHGATVMFSPTQPDEIIGYAAHDSNLLHFVYVKSVFRKLGFGRQLLLEVQPKHCTFLTKLGRKVLKGVPYNPFLLYQGAP